MFITRFSRARASEALGKFPEVFSNIVVSMIKIGELSGNLDKSLEYLSIQLQREADLKAASGSDDVSFRGCVCHGHNRNFAFNFCPAQPAVNFCRAGRQPAHYNARRNRHFQFYEPAYFFGAGGIVGFVVLVIAVYKTPAGKRAFSVFNVNFVIIKEITKKLTWRGFREF